MNKIKPIETEYNGYRFRSRLEARWAVFFDAAGIQYQYEPEGYLLPDGSMYLPDFFLPDVGGRAHIGDDIGLYVEVKGKMTEEDIKKIELFSGYDDEFGSCGNERSVLVVGDIPNESIIENCIGFNTHDFDNLYWNCFTVDGDTYPVEFYKNDDGSIGIYGTDNVDNWDGFRWFDNAYKKARQARFEHGEKPNKCR